MDESNVEENECECDCNEEEKNNECQGNGTCGGCNK